MNEQSLVLEICNLQDGDARAAYRNVQFDVRTYKKLKMFVHAEEVIPNTLDDHELTLFVRLGTDFVDNYYEYELPMDVSEWYENGADDIWPATNDIEIVFDDLINLKKERNAIVEDGGTGISYIVEYSKTDPKNNERRIKVKGSPNLQGLKTIMIGVRNPLQNDPNNIWLPDDGDAECVNVWVNEMRLTDFVSEGGSAAVGQLQLKLADFANINASGNYSGINWGSVDSRVQDRQRNEQIGFDLNSTIQLGQFFGKQARVSLPFFYGYSLGLINPEYDPFNPDIKLADYDDATRRERKKLGQDFNERKSFNFTNVRKEAKAGSKNHFWRISNWAASYAFSENLQRDFNTKKDLTKTWTGALNYNYTFKGKPLQPFKKWKPVQKNKYLKLIKDFNVFLMPKNISFTNDYSRIYNERQVRNNLVPDYEFDPIFLKRFDWNRKYEIGYDITRNLKTTFSARNQAIFEEGNNSVDRNSNPEGYREFLDTIRSQMATLGRTMQYNQNVTINYKIPFNKFPLTNWINANIKYTGGYNWSRAPLGQSAFGNTIQNSRNINMTSQANFVNLYNKVPFFKKILSDGRNSRGRINPRSGPGSKGSDGNNPKTDTEENKKWEWIIVEDLEPEIPLDSMTKEELKAYKKKNRAHKRKTRKEERAKRKVPKILGFFARMIMTVRNVSGTFALTDGTLLPGFSEESRFLGMNNSTTQLSGFVFGQQGYDVFGRSNGYNVSQLATDNNWLVRNENLNTQFATTHSANLSMRATLEPLKDVNIDLNLNRNYSNNSGEFYRWNEGTEAFEGQSQFQTSTLTYSTITWGTSFIKQGSQYQSSVFDNLLNNRTAVSQLIGSQNSNSSLTSAGGYYSGYSGSQQDVVLGAFMTAFNDAAVNSRNIDPMQSVPLPNWSVNYSGLTKYKWTKKFLKSFILRHGYSSTVSLNGMQTNLNSESDNQGNLIALDIDNNYIPDMQIQNVVISERFSPLIGIDANWIIGNHTLQTRFEYKKDRQATLALSNNQVTESLSEEIVIGTAARIKDVKLPFRNIKSSDVNIKFDFSFRDNLTVIRKIIENTNQATAGQKTVAIKISADYNLTNNLTLMFYYDQNLNTPKVQTSYPTGNVNTGFKIRFNLAGVQ
jgi:cell surface protein SprA